MEGIVFSVIALVGIFLSAVIFFASRYKRCPSDRILVIYGRIGGKQAAKCIHGGGALVLPLIQDYDYLSLTPMTMSIPLQNALSMQNIRVHVPSTFTVGVSTNPLVMANAAERLLGLTPDEIESMAKEIIFGQLRLTVASLTIEQINQDRERFLEEIRKNVEPELNKVGLILINVNITDITDESDYIESIGKKAAAEAINRAMIDVSEQDKLGAIGQAAANKEKEVRVAENIAEATKGKKQAEASQRVYVQEQEAFAVSGENEAKANIAETNAELAEKRAEAMQRSEVAKRNAEVAIQKAQYLAELERLKAEEVVAQQIAREKIEIAARATAEKERTEAKGRADGVLLEYEAQAEGIRKVLESKAKGYDALISSCNGDSKAAATMLMIEKMEEIARTQVDAIKNMKIDKVTVWDSGNAEKGSATANFVSSMIKSLPPLHEVAGMAGVELPENFLGKPQVNKVEKPIEKTE